jgi:HEPN domain-containing protein
MSGNYKLFFLLLLLSLGSCGPKSGKQESTESEGNEALYNEVMKAHDEVMPKMDDIYKLKEELNDRIANSPDIPEEKKKEIENILAKLDAADEGMRVWMRQFNPIPDSEGEEKAREYLENERERITKVKEDMLNAIEMAKAVRE